MPTDVRILFLADSHLGFDLPLRPRVSRPRRGYDFLANYAAALKPALAETFDLVVHGGDVFDRPVIPATLAYQAYEPLVRIAEHGIPVFIVPGNHERSRLPHARFALHPHVHVFDRARTFVLDVRGQRIALAGFPYERRNVRTRFPKLLESAQWKAEQCAFRLLCIHHCVEGATVGPGDFTFTSAADVIRCSDIPHDFSAVLSGHIHRQQVLTKDLLGRPLRTPVLYPGSIERTALAEIGEKKGYMVLRLNGAGLRWEVRPLPARPMIVKRLAVDGLSVSRVDAAVRAIVHAAPANAALTIRLIGELRLDHVAVLSAAHLRTFVPPSMIVDITPRTRTPVPLKDRVVAPARAKEEPLQLEL